MADVTTPPRIIPSGDSAIVVEFGDAVDIALSARVLALDARIGEAAIPGVTECVPSFRSLLVQFDPIRTDGDAVAAQVLPLTKAADRAAGVSVRHWRLPCCYEGDFSPDLADVGAETGLNADDVIARHVATNFHVYMVGFLPGAPYLGDLPPELDLPRLQNPRLRVPAGSVAIAMGLSVIYPVESPGGWRIIGRCPAPMFSLESDPPALLAPGDKLRFEPVTRAEYDRLKAAAAQGEWRPQPETST